MWDETPSQFGINVSPQMEPDSYGGGGRVSKLLIRREDGSWWVNYDSGWALLPTDEEAADLVRRVLSEVEGDGHG